MAVSVLKHHCITESTDYMSLTLFRYFEAHLAVKAELVKQSLHSDGGTVVPQQPFYKVRNDYHHPDCTELLDGNQKCDTVCSSSSFVSRRTRTPESR